MTAPRDVFAIVTVLFVFGFISMTSMVIYQNMISAWESSGLYVGQVQSTGNAILEAFKMYDWIIVVVMLFLIAGLVLANFKLRTSPAFFILTFVEAVFTGYVSYFFNYVFVQIVSVAEYNLVIAFFPRTLIILTNMHWVALVAIVLGSIALYGKKPSEDTFGGTVNEE